MLLLTDPVRGDAHVDLAHPVLEASDLDVPVGTLPDAWDNGLLGPVAVWGDRMLGPDTRTPNMYGQYNASRDVGRADGLYCRFRLDLRGVVVPGVGLVYPNEFAWRTGFDPADPYTQSAAGLQFSHFNVGYQQLGSVLIWVGNSGYTAVEQGNVGGQDVLPLDDTYLIEWVDSADGFYWYRATSETTGQVWTGHVDLVTYPAGRNRLTATRIYYGEYEPYQVNRGVLGQIEIYPFQWHPFTSGCPPLRQRQRDDRLRAGGAARGRSTSRQGSVRQGWKGTYL